MKTTVMVGMAAALILMCSGQAKAWNCSDPLAERVVVPSTTTGAQGDGDGQLATYDGQVYECEVVPTTPTTSTSPSTSNSSSTSNSNAASNSSSTANSSSNSASSAENNTKVVAKGGNSSSTATGGNASATGGNANQSQSQKQSLSNVGNATSASEASNNGNSNGDNSNNSTSVTNVPRSAATAYAPIVPPTTPCFKGYSGGGQGTMFGFSFGGGKIDANCAELEASRLAPSLLARCKVYITNKYVKQAGVTLDDCLNQERQVVPVVSAPIVQERPIIVTAAPPQITVEAPIVNVPAPTVTIIPPPTKPKTVHMPRAHKPHPVCPCYDNDNLPKN